MRWLRLAGIAIAGLLVVLVGTVALALHQLDTHEDTQRWLARTLSAMLSTQDSGVSIGRVGGNLISRIDLRDVALSDRDGTWATLDTLHVGWAPGDLLGGTLHVKTIAAGTLTVQRAPVPAQTRSKSRGTTSLPVAVALDTLQVATIALEAPLLGEPARLTLTGDAKVDTGLRNVVLDLKAQRTDGQAGGVSVRLHPPDGEGFALDVAYDEPPGGIAARLLGLPGEPALSLRLDGTGPETDWHGTLTARAEGLARVDTTVAVALTNRVRVALDGDADIGGVLPPALQPALARLDRLHVRAERAHDGTTTVSELAVTAPVGRLSMTGRVLPTLDATTTLDVTDAALLSDIAGTPLDGAVQAIVHAAGDLDAPALDMTVMSDRLSGSGSTLNGVALTIASGPSGATINGSIARLESAGAPPVEHITWAITGAPTGDRIDVQRLEIASPLLTITGRARLGLDDRSLDATLAVSADELGLWRGLTGLELAGRTKADLSLRGSLDAGIDLDMTVQGSDLATHIPAADALLGGRLDGTVRVHRTADGAIALRDIHLDAADLTVRGHGEMIGPDAQRASPSTPDARSELTIAVPRLAQLGKALGTPLTGSAKTVVEIARTDATTTGHVAADATLDGKPVKLATKLALEGQRLTLDGLRLDAAGATLAGGARVALDTQLTDGALTVAVPDLAALSKLVGQSLAGRLQGRVKLVGEKSGQRVELALDATALKSGDVGIAKAALSGTVTDALRKPRGRLTATVSDLRAGATTVARTELKADGALDQLSWAVVLNGKAGQAFTLDLGGQLARQGDAQRVTLQRLTAKYGDIPIKLERPVVVEQRADALSLGSTMLDLGKGRVRIAATRRGEQLTGDLEIQDLPLALARVAVPTLAVGGQLGGKARLTGTLAAPDLSVTLALRRVTVGNTGAQPIDGDITAGWRAGRAQATARLTGMADRPLQIAARLPVAYQPAPFQIGLADGPISVRVDGAVDLQRALLIAGVDQPATGRIMLALEIAGTAQRPQVNGSAELANGRYVDNAMGVTVGALTAKLVGSGTRLDLTTLSANDGHGGTLNGRGGVDFGVASPAFDGSVTLTNFGIYRNDLEGAVDGTVRFGGSTKGAQIAGDVTMRKAEIRVPDRLPATLVNIDVVEINTASSGSSGAPPAENEKAGRQKPSAAAPEAAIPIKLDVTIHLPGQVLVRGRGLDSEWRGDLKVAGTAANPDIQGTLTVVRGRFDFLGKPLDLSGGKLNFVGGDPEPFIDISAVSKTTDFTATIQLTGKASHPNLTLTSDPSLPQDEILSRMLFDKRVDQLSAAQAIQLAQSVAQLTGGGGGGLIDKIRKTTGLDVIDIKSSEDQKGATGPTLSVGKYVGNRTMITAEQGATSNSSRAGVEIGITDNLSVKTDAGASGDSRLGLNWKMDY